MSQSRMSRPIRTLLYKSNGLLWLRRFEFDRGLAPVQRPEGESAASDLYRFGHISDTDISKHRRTPLFCRQYIGPTLGIPEHWTRCAVHEEEVETFTAKKVSHQPGFALPKRYLAEPPNSLPPHP
jgi:hypothetical protein